MAGISGDIADDIRMIRKFICCCHLRCSCTLMSVPRNVHLFLFIVCLIAQACGTIIYQVHVSKSYCLHEVCQIIYWIQIISTIVYVCLACTAVTFYIRMVKCGHGGIDAFTLCHVICFPILTLLPASLSLTGGIIAYTNRSFLQSSVFVPVSICFGSGILGICAYIISVVGYLCVKINRKKIIDTRQYIDGRHKIEERDPLIPK